MMFLSGNTSTKNYFICSSIDCRNESWAYNETYNISWPYEYDCIYESRPENFSGSTIFQTFVYFMYGIIILFALTGNGLVYVVIQTTPRMKTVTNYFIANLAVGDILMTVSCVPFSFVPILILRYWPFGGLMCKIVNYSQAVSVFVTSYTLLAISIDRYMAITQPLKPRLEKSVAKMVVAAVWCGALCTAAPIPIVSRLQQPSPWHEVCKAYICAEQWENATQSHQYTCALLTLQFVLPLCALVFTYARIAYVVWSVRPPGEAQSVRDLRMQTSKRKMLKMMVTVVAVFTVCWLPLNIFLILWDVHSEDVSWVKWPGMPYVWFACHWLAMSHSCYNPIIYGYMNSRFRSGFKSVIQNLFCRKATQMTQTCNNKSVCDGIPLSGLIMSVAFETYESLLAILALIIKPHIKLGQHSGIPDRNRSERREAKAQVCFYWAIAYQTMFKVLFAHVMQNIIGEDLNAS